LQVSSNHAPADLLLFLVALFAAVLSIAGLLSCYLSGWYALSRRFRAHSEPYGQTRSAGPFFYGVKMRWTNYANVIRIVAAEDAIYISIMFLLRLSHPPLRIPWQEIKLGRTKILWRRYIVLTLGDEERIPMRISERMARNLGILDRLPDDALPH
jgi:hypothetical protein